MSNSIIKKILNQKAKRFRSSFSEDAKDLYFGDDDKLFHAAEYGRFREGVASEFLRLLIPRYISIGNGFVVTSKNDRSTQCDIIFYDGELTPLIQDDHNNQFFPSDSIKGIGEVKSDLTQRELLDALLKLSTTKRVAHEIGLGSVGSHGTEYSRRHFSDYAYSFLICNKIKGSLEGLGEKIGRFYHENGVENQYRHSFILSLDGNALCYKSKNSGVCPYPFTFGNDDYPTGNPAHHISSFDEAITAFAQLTYVALTSQQRVIINWIEYINS
ncbi:MULTISPECIES: DUF6602 domain-containing protein [Serratia]|uniref:DUF6602 domain-containing protein n=1 Tax=Serratia TaxID=613 RepID=UPI000E0379A4|nr:MULTISPECIES: DUF6602 domain-containing protein [Serratia]MDW5500026.1 DUF6602 domain-containing protein [Serratia proteamaculans]MDW5505090.1 DUF6602 domain-containing protein [Pseudomonas lundensis]SUI80562.1 Uncharacterised protein [Serratia liquefaciens]